MIGCPVAERFALSSIAFDISLSGDGGCTVASPTIAFPGPGVPAVCGPYGNAFAIVVGAFGSFSSRRSLNTLCACAPSFAWSAAKNSARCVSSPPPAPKRAPSRHVIATTSVRFHGGS